MIPMPGRSRFCVISHDRQRRFDSRKTAQLRLFAILKGTLLFTGLLLWGRLAPAADKSESAANAAIERRLTDTEQFLASEKLEGRGPGTHGIDLAADFIAAEFKQAGLKTDLYDGSP